MVRESRSRWQKVIMTVSIVAYICMILVLIFSPEVSELLHIIWKNISFRKVHLLLYIVVIMMTSIFTGIGVYQMFIHTKVKEISANISQKNSQVGVTAEYTESCLEQYRIELIYVFEELSKKYDAIVFEDMDRLEAQICIDIFTHLREINYSINERTRRKKCKFLYVINDELMSSLDQTKFFDYIMPIVPEVGFGNVRKKMQEILIDIGIDINDFKLFLKVAQDIPELSDYRVVNQIKNEYYVFELIEKNKVQDTEKNLDSKDKAKILAFVIYKVMLPKDYYLIRKMESVFFPIINEEQVKSQMKTNYCYEMAYKLWESGFLRNDCMKYIGYSQKEILEWYHCILSAGDSVRKKEVLENDEEFLCRKLCENAGDEIISYISGIEDIFMQYLLSDFQNSVEIMKKFLTYVGKNETKTYTLCEKSIQLECKTADSLECTLIFDYFVKRGYEEYDWLNDLLNDLLEDDINVFKYLESIEQLDEDGIMCIIGNKKVWEIVQKIATKHTDKMKEYSKITKIIDENIRKKYSY